MDKVKELFALILGVDSNRISTATTSQEIDSWTSLNHLNLVSTFEQEFNISIEPEEIVLMTESFGKFQEIIISKLNSNEN